MEVDSKQLKEYLLKNIIKGKKAIDDNEPLFSTGLIDSFGMLDLLFFIREEFRVNIEDYDIIDNNVNSLNDLIKIINEKR
jgi:acyl carrier protein